MKWHILFILAVAAHVAHPVTLAAQTTPPGGDQTLEDLLRIDILGVFGASERLQPVTEAPSSVTIVTADEIARYGYRTLADVLRGVRGLYVSDDRNYSFLGVRGFSDADDFNSRVLLLVNGHQVNDNVYSQAQVGAEFGIDPAMFERVEIIRGPSSSLYGTGAFLAVINVITRTGASLHGSLITVEAGSLGTQLVRASSGQRLMNGLDVAVSATLQRSDGMRRLYIPAFDTPDTNGGIAEGLDGEHVAQLYGHAAFKDVTMTATYGRREKDVPTAPYNTVFNMHDPRLQTTDRRALVDAQYDSSMRGAHVALRASFDRYNYNGAYPYPGASGDALTVNYDSGIGTRWGIDGRVTRTLPGRQTLTAGGEFFDNVQQDQDNHYDTEDGTIIHQHSLQQALFLQDEIRLKAWLLVNGGLRYDGYQGRTLVSPRAAVIVVPSPNQSFKYLYGQAFRAPNAYELSYYSRGVPNSSLTSEGIASHEVVWEQYTGTWIRTSVSAYHHRTQDLIRLQPDAQSPLGLAYMNTGHVTARGLELEAEMRLKWRLQSLASYAIQRATDNGTRLSAINSPTHMATLRVSVPGPTRQSSAAFEWNYLSQRSTREGQTVAPESIVKATVRQPIGRRFEMFVSVANLFNQSYSDPAAQEYKQISIAQNGRVVRVGVQWKLPAP